MKTLEEVLTTPNPSPRDEFILNTAKAIYLRNGRHSLSDDQCAVTALIAAAVWGIFEYQHSVHAVGFLRRRIVAVVHYLRAIAW